MSECRTIEAIEIHRPVGACRQYSRERPDLTRERGRRDNEERNARPAASISTLGGCLSMMKHIGFLAFYSQPEAVEREVKNGGGIQR